ncbi:hypothetical protein AYO45_01710 [Gammaproteobacteria bacterium SCGC AG-212-F23]|nr:hypothetical protein AYO45_01710 [Gammaproteobacteria bacterium SCGC AG-212-F23]
MQFLFNICGIFGLLLNMLGTFLIIKHSLGFKESKEPGTLATITFGDQGRSKMEKCGFKILFIGFFFQFIAAFGEFFNY